MRAIITTGEVKGMSENQNASGELGSLSTDISTMTARMMGIMIGVCNCAASCALSPADPTAANIAE